MTANHSSLSLYIDHTCLRADAVSATILKLCEEARQFQFYSVCVNSSWVPFCKEILAGSEVRISAVCGFPLGAMASEAKAYEAANAVAHGADEIDMVIPIGLLIEGDYAAVYADIRKVVDIVGEQAKVKAILETGLLCDEQKREGCRIAEHAGAHYVKTSTGFIAGGAGGATTSDIRLMFESVSSHIGIKASGGIKDTATAWQMIEAGATRLGTSSGMAIVNGEIR